MSFLFRPQWLILIVSCALSIFQPAAVAGGGPFNTVVIVNARSTNSLELGNYYCERRQIPPENVIRIDWQGGNVSWTLTEFQSVLLVPLQNALAARRLTNQIHYVVLSMDIPIRVVSGTAVNSTTSTLFYGFKGPTDLKSTGSAYAFSEAPFEFSRQPASFLAVMLTARTLDEAKRLIDRGVASDGTFPEAPVILAKTSDILRNQRYRTFDTAMFSAAIDGRARLVRTNTDSTSGLGTVLGLQTGLANFRPDQNMFVPGAIADSMTSFGGIIFGPNGQTSLLEWIHAGATASYGTVTEPSADPAKFPDPMVYFYQARGFNIAESYYQSIPAPYLGLIVGEPLAAPFAKSATGEWPGHSSNQVLSGTAPLNIQFASAPAHPIQQVDLFVDGRFFQTLTNIPPAAGNVVSGFMHGRNIRYSVRTGDTPNVIASSLAGLVNIPAATNLTGISATVRGDRLVLTRFTTNVPPRPGAPSNIRSTSAAALVDPNPISLAFSSLSTSPAQNSTVLNSSRPGFHPSTANGQRTFTISGAPETNGWLRLQVSKAHSIAVTVSVTNQSGTMTAFQITSALANAVASHPDLKTDDGIAIDDLTAGWFNSGSITFRARTAGLEGGEVRLNLDSSPGLTIGPESNAALNQNASDLLPRNHVYVAAGLSDIDLSFAFDTRLLEDGYHELTAVAYEGSHVRTQSRATLPVLVRNADFEAALQFSTDESAVSLSGTHVFRVSSTDNLASVTLMTTGGPLSTVVGQNPALFSVNALQLGAGLHPFFAVAVSASGARYRTAPVWIRFVP